MYLYTYTHYAGYLYVLTLQIFNILSVDVMVQQINVYGGLASVIILFQIKKNLHNVMFKMHNYPILHNHDTVMYVFHNEYLV